MLGKKMLFAGIMLSALLAAGCEELMNKGFEVGSSSTTVDFVVKPTDVMGEAVFATTVIDSELDRILEENGITLDQLNSIKIKEARLELLNENEAVTFDFFEQFSATIEVDGLPELTIAVADSIPAGARSIQCEINADELVEYLEAEQYILKAKGVSTAPITDTLYIQGVIEFSVYASASDLTQ